MGELVVDGSHVDRALGSAANMCVMSSDVVVVYVFLVLISWCDVS